MIKQIPNLVTCLNIISGTLAIFLCTQGELQTAAIFIGLAMIFDFLDGLIARLLKAYSEIGKELDSLADVVSFGVAPAFIAYTLILNTLPGGELCYYDTWTIGMKIMLFTPLLIPAFSAYRLAKFNLDTRQTTSFIGMPTPANALFWLSILIASEQDFVLYHLFIANTYTLGLSVIILSILLISELPMFSLKIKNITWKDNKVLYLYLASIIIIAILIGKAAIITIIPIYILLSIIMVAREFTKKD